MGETFNAHLIVRDSVVADCEINSEPTAASTIRSEPASAAIRLGDEKRPLLNEVFVMVVSLWGCHQTDARARWNRVPGLPLDNCAAEFHLRYRCDAPERDSARTWQGQLSRSASKDRSV